LVRKTRMKGGEKEGDPQWRKVHGGNAPSSKTRRTFSPETKREIKTRGEKRIFLKEKRQETGKTAPAIGEGAISRTASGRRL